MAEVEFLGSTFALRAKLPQYALMKFAQSARHVEANTLDALGAMLDLLQKCITVEDWPRFDELADEEQPEIEDLFKVVAAVFEAASDRPTGQPSDSSDGPTTTPLKSVSQPVDRDMELAPNRPDIRMAMRLTRGEMASA